MALQDKFGVSGERSAKREGARRSASSAKKAHPKMKGSFQRSTKLLASL